VSVSLRELWSVFHGLIFGSIFLLAFAGGLAGLYSLKPEWVTVAGLAERIRRLMAGTWVMALVAWATVISGTYFLYPWDRAQPPEGADLANFPQSLLLSNLETAGWHTFAMEWKQHVAWFAPILATTVAYVVAYYGPQLAKEQKMRRTLLWLFVVAFAAAGVAGLFGAFLNKVAPVR
jgi:hypothetical protein